jgi:hypothetical protein
MIRWAYLKKKEFFMSDIIKRASTRRPKHPVYRLNRSLMVQLTSFQRLALDEYGDKTTQDAGKVLRGAVACLRQHDATFAAIYDRLEEEALAKYAQAVAVAPPSSLVDAAIAS